MIHAKCVMGLAILIVMWSVVDASAGTYYVAMQDQNASDQNAGTEDLPWKTLGHATETTREGDVVFVKSGVYCEGLIPKTNNVHFSAFENDAVILAPPDSKTISQSAWTPVKGLKNVYECMPPNRTSVSAWGGDCVLRVDGLALEFVSVKRDPNSKTARPANLIHSEVRRWTVLENGKLQINLGSGDPARHQIELAEKGVGIVLNTKSCSVRGFEIRDADTGLSLRGEKNVAEDCVVRDATHGADLSGSDNVIRRCAFMHCWVGINAGDCPGRHIIEENLLTGIGHPCLRNRSPQTDLNNPWGPRCGIHFGNINFTVIRYNVLSDVVWAGWWPDVNCYGNYFYGNLVWNGGNRGIYNEYPSNDSRILYNAIAGCEDGITFRFCWHTMTMYNYLSGNTNSGLTFWGPHTDATYLFDNLISRNLVEGSRFCVSIKDDRGVKAGLPAAWASEGKMSPSSRFRMGSNQFEDNLYRGAPKECFANYNGVKFSTLEAFTSATGLERGSRMDDNASLRDFSLERYTIRVPESCNPGDVAPLVGNPVWRGVHADPLPYAGEDNVYFWSQGNADSPDRNPAFGYSYEWPHFEKPVRRLVRSNPEADPTVPPAPDAEPITWLECIGTLVERIPKAGSGFWSPSMPTVGGAEIHVSWQMSGENLKLAGEEGGPVAWVRFQTLTGQHVQQKLLMGKNTGGESIGGEPLMGSFPWRHIDAKAIVPSEAKRFSIFLGLRPASGTVRFSDIRIDTLPGSTIPLPAVVPKTYKPITLAAYANHDLNKDMGASKGAPDPESFVRDYCCLPTVNLEKLKQGRCQVGDIPFEIGRVVTLRCFRRPPADLPLEVNNIAIQQPVTSLFFLHAGPKEMGTQEYWRYVIHYEDGQTVEIVPVSAVGHLCYRQPYFVPDAPIQPALMAGKQPDVGYCLQWINPRPEVAIKSLDFHSMDAGQAVLLALTAGIP